MEEYINITLDNIDQEHICCAISDKKHFEGVFNKKEWLKKRITEGHVFRKLNVQGKVFVEYAPLEKAWVPIEGNGFLYIYCLWVSGNLKVKVMVSNYWNMLLMMLKRKENKVFV